MPQSLLPGAVTLASSATGTTLFVEPAPAIPLNNAALAASAAASAEESLAILGMQSEAARCSPALERLQKWAVAMDLAGARGGHARWVSGMSLLVRADRPGGDAKGRAGRLLPSASAQSGSFPPGLGGGRGRLPFSAVGLEDGSHPVVAVRPLLVDIGFCAPADGDLPGEGSTPTSECVSPMWVPGLLNPILLEAALPPLPKGEDEGEGPRRRTSDAASPPPAPLSSEGTLGLPVPIDVCLSPGVR